MAPNLCAITTAEHLVLQRLLQGAGATPQLLAFSGGHSIDASVLGPISQFIRGRQAAEPEG